MRQEPIGNELESVLSRLTEVRPRERHPSGWSDEHERWWLYSELLDEPSARELLLEAVRLEPDVHVASSVSMDMVTRPDEDPGPWIAALPVGSREAELVAQRASDVRVVRDVLAGEHVAADQELGTWSDWLQRRVAEQCGDPDLLRRLSAHANTSKVRRQALDRARQLTGGRKAAPRPGPVTAAEVISDRNRRLAEDPVFRAQMEAAERERAEQARLESQAEQPILADLAAVGIEVTSVWDLHEVRGSRDRAIPVLLDHLARDYPDRVLEGVGDALADRSDRHWWPQLKALYLRTDNDLVRDRLAAALQVVATRAHFEDLTSFLHNERLGRTRIYFLRPLNRIGNRMSPGKGRAIVQSLATDPVFAAEASAILAGRGPND